VGDRDRVVEDLRHYGCEHNPAAHSYEWYKQTGCIPSDLVCGRRATANLRPFAAYSPERQVQFFDRMLAGIEKLPGLRYAAVMSSPPMAPFSELDCGMRADNGPRIDDAVSITSVSTQCVQALGIRLVAGMFLDARDRGGPQVNSVNQTLAHLTFRGSNPLGHRINSEMTLVGVVADIRHRALDEKFWPELFLPYEQSPSPWVTELVRGSGDPCALAPAIRRMAVSVDPSQPLFDVGLLGQRVVESLVERRERATILDAFAGLALLIAAVGIYGVMSCSVVRRRHEIRIRMALGARQRDVLQMVVSAGFWEPRPFCQLSARTPRGQGGPDGGAAVRVRRAPRVRIAPR
jgi:putative ABC transport system permease protein